MARVSGYQYEYDFSIKEELASKYEHKLFRERGRGYITLIFEVRTSFIARAAINGGDNDNDNEDVMIDSEVLDAVLYDDRSSDMTLDIYLEFMIRFADYWMSKSEIRRFGIEAVDFVRRAADAADPPRRVAPVFVDFKVITVQQDGEPVSAAFDRALAANKLVPFFEWPFSYSMARQWPNIPVLRVDFVRFLNKERVGDMDSGLAMMRICNLCSQGPNIGSQISKSRMCGHAFHSHCFAQWVLRGNNLCPTCPSVVFDPQNPVFLDCKHF